MTQQCMGTKCHDLNVTTNIFISYVQQLNIIVKVDNVELKCKVCLITYVQLYGVPHFFCFVKEAMR
jgi:hypothetical protein